MEWWRAKLILIAAFLCLDLFLGRQVWALRGISAPAATGGAQPQALGNTGTPTQLPELKVRTVGWQETWLSALIDPTCRPQQADGPGGRASSPSVQCTSAIDGSQLDWYNGLLIFSNDRPYRTPQAEQDEALQVIRRIDPGGMLPGMPLTPLQPSTATQNRTFVVLERYDNDLPLFNAHWTITVGPHGVQAERWWVSVEGAVPSTPQPLISAQQALAVAAAQYGPQAASTAPAELGYYYPHPQPPALPTQATTGDSPAGANPAPALEWYVKPVYRVYVGPSECVYVDAWGGEPVDGMHSDC